MRPVSRRTRSRAVRGSASSTSKCVTRRAGAVAAGGDDRAPHPVAAERRVDRPALGVAGGPPRARGTRADLARADHAPQRAVRLLGARRPPSGPRCRGRAGARCRARSGSGPPAALPGAPGRASRRRGPAPGWTTTPAGLSTTSRCSSSCTTSKMRRRRLGAAGRGRLDLDALAGLHAGGSSAAARPSTVTRALVDQAGGRGAREAGPARPRTMSSRSRHPRARRPLDHVQQPQHARARSRRRRG